MTCSYGIMPVAIRPKKEGQKMPPLELPKPLRILLLGGVLLALAVAYAVLYMVGVGKETQEDLAACNGALHNPPIQINSGINREVEMREDNAIIYPWEDLYINNNQKLAFGPNTVIVYFGDLDNLTTVKRYACTNRRFFDVFGMGELAGALNDYSKYPKIVENMPFLSYYCVTHWKCKKGEPYTIVVIKNGIVVAEFFETFNFTEQPQSH